MKFDRIGVVGLGYIGLPTAAVFASRKLQVTGFDTNRKVVDIINSGAIHIVEPGLEDVVHEASANGYLRASATPEPADAFLIAVPTPFREGHTPNLAYVEAAAKSVATVLKAGDLVVLESTSPVGTTEQVSAWMAAVRPDLTFPHSAGEASDIRVAHCPERVLPGNILRELVENDRVIGGITPKCSAAAAALYKLVVSGECVITDARTAEMCKLTENSFRDVNIAFANELSIICDQLGIDVWELIRLANRHPRVNILQPGPGVGGHCIAVDPWFIVSQSPELARLIRTAREINDGKPRWVLDKISQKVGECLSRDPARTARQVTIACLGAAFKADIDDLRESPSLGIVKHLGHSHPGPVWLVEPNIHEFPSMLDPERIELVDVEKALAEADILIILVDHTPFKAIDWSKVDKPIVDAKGLSRR